jgi:hypothetical protein
MKGAMDMKLLTIVLVVLSAMSVLAQPGPTEDDYHREGLVRGWDYQWIGPRFEGARPGYIWQKDFQGEVVLLSGEIMAIENDKYRDLIYFSHGDGTSYHPSLGSLRVGSKVRIRCDNSNNVRWVNVLPFHVWLKDYRKRYSQRKKPEVNND